MPRVGAVELDVTFNTSQMARDLSGKVGVAAGAAAGALSKTFEARLATFGQSAEKFGKTFTTHVSLPLAGLGTLATREFATYESSLAKISGLTGVNREQVQGWSDQVRKIGIDFGVGAKDAADALYFITSSGIQGQQALDTLSASAKASAAGLGSTKTVADIVTSALNAYAGSGLTAAQSTDILTAAVAGGKGEPEELADSLGKVLPIAANLGVSFDQVAGATAAMTLTGSDAFEATTQLRGVLQALVKPSTQAEDALASVGLSSDGLKKQIKEQGLLAALQTLVTALGNDSEATAQVFGDVRALTGVMNLLGKNTDQTRKVMDATAHSAGATNRAFDEASHTTEFRLNQSLASLHDSLIDIGAAVAPVAEAVVGGAAAIGRGFERLPGPVKSVAVTVGSIAIVAGPVIYAVGKVSSALSTLASFGRRLLDTSQGVKSIGMTSETAAKQVEGVNTGFRKAAQGISAAGIAIGGFFEAKSMLDAEVEKNKSGAASTGDSILDAVLGSKGVGDSEARLKRLREQLVGLQGEIEDIKGRQTGFVSHLGPGGEVVANIDSDVLESYEDFAHKLEDAERKGRALDDTSKQLAARTGANADEVRRWLGEQAKAGTIFPTVDAALAEYQRSQAGAAAATGQTTSNVEDQRQKLAAMSESFFGFTDAQTAYQRAIEGIATAQRGEAEAARRVDEANRSYQKAVEGVATAQHGVEEAGRKAQDAQRAYGDALQRVTDAEQKRQDSLRAVEDAQQAVIDAQNELNDALRGPSTDEQLGIDAAQLALERAQQRLKKGGFEDPLDKREAELAVRRAQQDLLQAQQANAERTAQAQENLASAQERLVSAQADAEGSLRAVEDAQRGVEDAARGITDAQRGLVDANNAVRDAQQGVLDASRGISDAKDAQVAAHNAVRDAQLQAADAARQLDEKQAAFAADLEKGSANAGPFLGHLEDLKKAYPEVADALQGYIDKFTALQGLSDQAALNEFYRRNPNFQGPITAADARKWLSEHPEGRAYGGPVRAGTPYQVTELGMPELFVDDRGRQIFIPPDPGTIVPLANVSEGQGGGDTYHITVTGQEQPRATARAFILELRERSYLGRGT